MEKPAYADFDAPHKFEAIRSIIAKRLREHPNAICSYSGGSDSDILIHNVETVREMFRLPPVKYMFFETGLEMDATRRHVAETAEKYGVEIMSVRPKMSIVSAVRKYGCPIFTKIASQKLAIWQHHGCEMPLSIREEFLAAEDKPAKRRELQERYPGQSDAINFFCNCNHRGEIHQNSQFYIDCVPYLSDFMKSHPPEFAISAKCCDICKKQPAHDAQKDYDMVITGERWAEGGVRAVGQQARGCFAEMKNGQYRLKPLYYVSDRDKAWYKETYGIRYSDAYEVYGLKRTGCCGCPISLRAVSDLEKIRPFEPNVVKAAWNVFGDAYRYRAEYMAYREKRKIAEKEGKENAKHDGEPMQLYLGMEENYEE